MATELVTCQFCGESGFDLKGLSRHYDMDWCDGLIAQREALAQEEAARRPQEARER